MSVRDSPRISARTFSKATGSSRSVAIFHAPIASIKIYARTASICLLTSCTEPYSQGLRSDMFHYTGMFCSAGYQSIYLDEYGNVAKGQFCGRMPYTILERNPFEDPNFFRPVRCTEAHCTCIPYTSLPKWRDAAHAPEWFKDGV